MSEKTSFLFIEKETQKTVTVFHFARLYIMLVGPFTVAMPPLTAQPKTDTPSMVKESSTPDSYLAKPSSNTGLLFYRVIWSPSNANRT